MAGGQKNHSPICHQASRQLRYCIAVFGIVVATIHPTPVGAQRQAIYVAGNAAVTGFSSALPPVQIAPGVDPSQKTFIDLNGPSLRIVDLQHLGGAPQAQLVGATKPFTFTAAQLGQVFGVAIDDSQPPNIYAAATSAYGLPIVGPAADGQLQHIPAGAPNATFMPGLWGPQGGPGSIWKIDGASGTVTLFANVVTNGRANSGAALGALAYDSETKSFYVGDRESGLIHRLDLKGNDLGAYDHGIAGRSTQGLPPEPWISQQPIDVARPQFDSTQPATWNYAAPARRVFGLAVHERRLYYAVADSLQIWSIGLNADGSFGKDAVIELAAPPSAGPTEISTITFDEQGRLFLADRPAPTGAFDFEALAVPAIGRVLRYALVEIMPNGRRIWQQQPDDYAIGFPPDFHNGNGGVAIGYNYDHAGNLVPGSCGGFMWTTGENLRQAADPTLAARLGQSGPLDVNGLQGNGTWRIQRGHEPPLESYFIDYQDEFDDMAERGHMGDIAIERLCSPVQRAGLLPYGGAPPIGAPPVPPRAGTPPGGPPPPGTPPPPPTYVPPPPPGGCLPGQVRDAATGACGSCAPPNIQVNGKCCSVTQLAATAACSNSSCPSGQTAIGPSNFCCPSGQVYSGASGAQSCCSTALVNGKCPSPVIPPITTCGKGYVPVGGSCCLSSQMTSTGVCCPSGQAPSGPNRSQCENIVLIPIKIPPGPQCCASGIPTPSGQCCPAANVTTSGECCPGPVDPKNRKACVKLIPLASCAAGYTKMPDGSCCNARYVSADGKSCNVSGRPCAPGEHRDVSGNCLPATTATCPPGQFRDTNGACAPIPTTPCPPGEVRDERGVCVSPPKILPACPPGEERNTNGACVPIRKQGCRPGEILNERGNCVPAPKAGPTACPEGETRNARGDCVRTRPPPRTLLPPPPPVPPRSVPRRSGPILPLHGPIFRGPMPGPAGGGLFRR